MDEDFVKRAEKFCECGYKVVALIAISDFAERQGFKRTGITITCPVVGGKSNFNYIRSVDYESKRIANRGLR